MGKKLYINVAIPKMLRVYGEIRIYSFFNGWQMKLSKSLLVEPDNMKQFIKTFRTTITI